MVSWKTAVNPIRIQGHDVGDCIVEYDTLTGKHVIKSRKELRIQTIAECWRGFAKQHGVDLLGIFATNQGPVFFINDTMYILIDNAWGFIVSPNGGETRVFQFVFNKQII